MIMMGRIRLNVLYSFDTTCNYFRVLLSLPMDLYGRGHYELRTFLMIWQKCKYRHKKNGIQWVALDLPLVTTESRGFSLSVFCCSNTVPKVGHL